ncbi:MAG TPA: riboflavin kinase [Ktedonobacterales bacterium]
MRVEYLIGSEANRGSQQMVGAGALAVAVSDWDGVHLGHVALARRTAEVAAKAGARAVALLPWPSPDAEGEKSVARLTTLEERIALLDALGCFEVLLVATAPAETLTVEAALAWWRGLGDVRALLGARSPADSVARLWPAGLAEAARSVGMSVEDAHVESVEDDLSGQIRALVEAGRMREATAALGYTYTVTGVVIGGDRRGRLLGFPTANLRLEPAKLTPGNGIYAAWVWLPGATSPWPAAVSIGVRPTFEQDGRRLIEAHLLDATIDLYGVELQVQFVEWLRAEERFDGVEALIEQMNKDRERAREILRAEAPARRLASQSWPAHSA